MQMYACVFAGICGVSQLGSAAGINHKNQQNSFTVCHQIKLSSVCDVKTE